MSDLLGAAFAWLVQWGGGSEFVPLLVFCVFLVLLGLGLGMGAMRLLSLLRPEPDADVPQ